jgi:hypothetical protein
VLVSLLQYVNRSPYTKLFQNFKAQGTQRAGLNVRLQICIREVVGSNLGRDTGYPYWGHSWFFSLPPDKT